MSLNDLILITGKNIDQGVGIEAGKTKKEYVRVAAVCMIDKSDFKKLDCLVGTPVKVTTAYGEVTVYSTISEEGPHPGIIFIPGGPWANRLVNPEGQGMGTPTYKGIPAKLDVVRNGTVLSTLELVGQLKEA